MYDRILVTTDGSALSKKAVRHAIALARKVQASLVVLHVVPRYPVSYFEGAIGMSNDSVAATEKAWADHGQELVDAAASLAKAAKVTVKALVMQSNLVAETVVAAAKKHNCDVVVMASHGRKGIKRLLLGSETLHVLTHSHVPVLVLR